MSRVEIHFTEQILSTLSFAKECAELILDEAEGVLAIIDPNGRLLRTNNEFLAVSRLDPAQVPISKVLSIFEPGSETEIDEIIKKVSLDGKSLHFEKRTSSEATYLWSCQRLNVASGILEAPLLLLRGVDVSLIKKQQKELNDLYDTIPYAILAVGKDQKIEASYSAFGSELFGISDLRGRSIFDLVYQNSWEKRGEPEKKSILAALNCFGELNLIGELLCEVVPRQSCIQVPTFNGTKTVHLGVRVRPLCENDLIRRLLFQIEDRTALVEEEARIRSSEEQERITVERVLQIKRASPEFLFSMINELEPYFNRLLESTQSRDWKEAARLYHGIKGLVRIGGLSHLTKVAHEAEDRVKTILGKTSPDDQLLSLLEKDTQTIMDEWRESLGMIKAIHKSGRASTTSEVESEQVSRWVSDRAVKIEKRITELKASRKTVSTANVRVSFELQLQRYRLLWETTPMLSSLDLLLREQSIRNQQDQKWILEPQFKFGDTRIDHEVLQVLKEILIHLINNAYAHAEPRDGTKLVFKLEVERSGDRLQGFYEDNGKGFNLDKIRAAAVRQGRISPSSLIGLSKEEILELIFLQGFSTAAEITELSGRGVGLEVVRDRLTKFGGEIKAVIGSQGGARFDFRLKSEASWLPNSRKIKLVDLIACMKDMDELGCPLEIFESDQNQWQGLELWIDLSKLQMAMVLVGGKWCLRKLSAEQLQITQTDPSGSKGEKEDLSLAINALVAMGVLDQRARDQGEWVLNIPLFQSL
jgi:hypothetical protein